MLQEGDLANSHESSVSDKGCQSLKSDELQTTGKAWILRRITYSSKTIYYKRKYPGWDLEGKYVELM